MQETIWKSCDFIKNVSYRNTIRDIRIDLSDLGKVPVAGSCEHDNKLADDIKGGQRNEIGYLSAEGDWNMMPSEV